MSHESAIRQQKRSGVLCLILGVVTLLVGSLRAIPILLGAKADPSRESLLLVVGLVAITVLVGHGNRRIIAIVPPVPSRARSFGLLFAYITLAGLLAAAALNLVVSAASTFMLRDF